jgi:hypothetical protein
MAEKIRQVKKQIDPMTQDIIRLLGDSPDKCRMQDLNHCASQEEMEFEIFCDFIQHGMEEEKAKAMAADIAEDIWLSTNVPASS